MAFVQHQTTKQVYLLLLLLNYSFFHQQTLGKLSLYLIQNHLLLTTFPPCSNSQNLWEQLPNTETKCS